MPETPSLLVASGPGRTRPLLAALLDSVLEAQEESVKVEWAQTVAEALERLGKGKWSACLVDEEVGDDPGMVLVRTARERNLGVPMVLALAREDVALEDMALKEGAAEVVALSLCSPQLMAKALHAAMVRGKAIGGPRFGTGTAPAAARGGGSDRAARILEQAPIGITVSTVEEGRFLEANPFFCKLVGRSRDEIVGRTAADLGLWAEDRTRNAFKARIRSTGGVEGMETLLQTADGRLVHALTSASTIRFEGKACILGLTQDITGSRRAETELARREAQLEAAEMASGTGSWDYDPATTGFSWSPHFGRLVGVQDKARTLETFLARVEEADRERVAEAIRRGASRGAPVKVRHNLRLADGSVREMELLGMPEFDMQDEPIGLSGTLRPAPAQRPKRGEPAALAASPRGERRV